MRNREEKKCKKGQESTIGKIIYGFLLFMPLLAILVTCGYAMFNKNAYKQEVNASTDYIMPINNIDSLINGKNYQLIYQSGNESNTTSPWYKFSNIDLDYTNFNNYNPLNEYTYFYTHTNGYIYLYTDSLQNTDRIVSKSQLWGNDIKQINFTLDGYQNGGNLNKGNSLLLFVTYKEIKLIDTFYYSVNKVTESPLFNWAENSIIYTTTANTCNALSITTTFIPLLLAYWLIISVIYFLYDIALMLVWIIHRKIHELQESI